MDERRHTLGAPALKVWRAFWAGETAAMVIARYCAAVWFVYVPAVVAWMALWQLFFRVSIFESGCD